MITNEIPVHNLEYDFCVVGGGMAGICAAVAAARHGAKTVLVQDRPVLGGNASSEIRMWICGAGGKDLKETGILEEIQLENIRFNPAVQYNIWDHLLMTFVQKQENLKLMLNCTCTDVVTEDNRISSIIAWQTTTQKRFEIKAKYFADCSGDSILRFSGAEFRCGREAKDEFDESYAPDVEDKLTMGNSILIQTREVAYDRPFEVPPWAHAFEEKGFHRVLNPRDNFWWLEYGGELNTIDDAEEIRDELIRIAYGVWNLVKNGKKKLAKNIDLEWIGALPGKRENIRYVGDHILVQKDVEAQGRFDDIVAYGGWPFDAHEPAAFYYKGAPTTFHSTPNPFGIPFRCLYSKNIENLYFAGRNISCSHMAMSTTRVMATCAIEGQAIGTAAAMGVKYDLTPRGIYEQKITELQETLMNDDCYIPWHSRTVSDLTKNARLQAESEGNVELLRNGIDRNIQGEIQYFAATPGSYIEYHFDKPEKVNEIRIVFDSDLTHHHWPLLDGRIPTQNTGIKRMACHYPENGYVNEMPEELVKEYAVEIQTGGPNSPWKELVYEEDNFKRLVRIPVGQKVTAIRLIPEVTWGAEKARIYSFDMN